LDLDDPAVELPEPRKGQTGVIDERYAGRHHERGTGRQEGLPPPCMRGTEPRHRMQAVRLRFQPMLPVAHLVPPFCRRSSRRLLSERFGCGVSGQQPYPNHRPRQLPGDPILRRRYLACDKLYRSYRRAIRAMIVERAFRVTEAERHEMSPQELFDPTG